MRARYYDPGVGRFLSRDTWAINYADPVELNRYVYAANNPVRWSDPSGNNFIESIKLRIGAISASVTTGLVAFREAVTNAIDRVLIRFNLFWEQVCAAFQNTTTNNIVVRVGEGAVANYTKVRQIMHGEILDDIIDELKAMTWKNNVEYAVVRFTDNKMDRVRWTTWHSF